MSLPAFALAYLGFALLCLAMPRHAVQLVRDGLEPRARAYLRLFGWLAVLCTWPVAVLHSGFGVGTVAWLGTLTVAALTLVSLLTYFPRTALRFAEAAPLAIGLGVFIGI